MYCCIVTTRIIAHLINTKHVAGVCINITT